MLILYDIKEKDFIESVRKQIPNITEDDIKYLKTYYAKNKDRDFLVACKMAIAFLKSKQTRSCIILGWNSTRYKKSYLTAYDLKTHEIFSISASRSELESAKPMELYDVQGNEQDGLLIANVMTKKGFGQFNQISQYKTDFTDVKVGDKFIFVNNGLKIAIFEPIDWNTYDRNAPIQEAGRAEIYNKEAGTVSFTLSCFHDESNSQISIYFRDIPIRFFSNILLPQEFESVDLIQQSLSIVSSFAIPIYISKSPEQAIKSDGRVMTVVRATGFGMIIVPEDFLATETSPEISVSSRNIQKEHNDEKITVDLINKAIDILRSYDSMTVTSFEDSLKQIGITDVQKFIEKLCQMGWAIFLDPDTIAISESHRNNEKTKKQKPSKIQGTGPGSSGNKDNIDSSSNDNIDSNDSIEIGW